MESHATLAINIVCLLCNHGYTDNNQLNYFSYCRKSLQSEVIKELMDMYSRWTLEKCVFSFDKTNFIRLLNNVHALRGTHALHVGIGIDSHCAFWNEKE